MKINRIFLLAITFSLVLFSCNAPKQNEVTNNDTINSESISGEELPDENISGPRIVFENKLLEFGKIGPDSKASGEFKFRNVGNSVLEIESVSQCCGVVITYDKTKYQPGEKGAIKASYTANKQAGKISRIPIVTSNDPVEPTVNLLLTAEVVNKVVTQPESLKLFLDEDNAACPKLVVQSTDGKPFAIRDIKSTGNCIDAECDPNLKATEIVLDLKANVEKLKQNKEGYVDIIVTHPEMSVVTLPFDVVSRFTIHPPKITALNTDPGVVVVRKIWVYNKYNKDFEVESITSQNNYISVLSEGKVENGYQFEIQITPPPTDGKTYFHDELNIQIKDGEKLKVDCDGFYNPPQEQE